MVTKLGFGTQNAKYNIDLNYGTFNAYNYANTYGTFNLFGTWDGGNASGTIQINGLWEKAPDQQIVVRILNNDQTYWTATTSQLSNDYSLIQRGGLGQFDNNYSPVSIILDENNNKWRIKFNKNSFYSYDKSEPSYKYLMGEYDGLVYGSDNTYSYSQSSSGTFFDISQNLYYSMFAGISGSFNGTNIVSLSTGEVIDPADKNLFTPKIQLKRGAAYSQIETSSTTQQDLTIIKDSDLRIISESASYIKNKINSKTPNGFAIFNTNSEIIFEYLEITDIIDKIKIINDKFFSLNIDYKIYMGSVSLIVSQIDLILKNLEKFDINILYPQNSINSARESFSVSFSKSDLINYQKYINDITSILLKPINIGETPATIVISSEDLSTIEQQSLSASIPVTQSIVDNPEEIDPIPPPLSTSLSPTGYVVDSNYLTDNPNAGNYYIPPKYHIGRNVLPHQTKATLNSNAPINSPYYVIDNCPPGLFEEVDNYVIIPSDNDNKDWQYFYTNTSNFSYKLDGTTSSNSAYAEFPNSVSPTGDQLFITTTTNNSNQIPLTLPGTQYTVSKNRYEVKDTSMFAWGGKKHFGFMIGDPDAINIEDAVAGTEQRILRKYLIY